MRTLRDIWSKIRGYNSLGKYLHALNLISINRFRKSSSEVSKQLPYLIRLKEAIEHLCALEPELETPILRRAEGNLTCLLVLTTDRGFVGNFNHRLREEVLKFVASKTYTISRLVVFGRKGEELFREWGKVEVYSELFTKTVNWDIALDVFDSILKGYLSGHYHSVHVAYQKPTLKVGTVEAQAVESTARLDVEIGQIYYELFKERGYSRPPAIGAVAGYHPIIVRFIPPTVEGRYSPEAILNFEGDKGLLIDQMVRLYLNFMLRVVLLEHFTSELSARFIRTREILRNIESSMEELQSKLRRLRQESINSEVFNIVNSYLSMEKKAYKDLQPTGYILEVGKAFDEEDLKERLGRFFTIREVIKKEGLIGFRLYSRSRLYDFSINTILSRLLSPLPETSLRG